MKDDAVFHLNFKALLENKGGAKTSPCLNCKEKKETR